MATTDDGLDATSRRLLNEIDELKRLELEKRHTARSSEEFHDLASKVDNVARHVFDTAGAQLIEGEQDSPLPDERDEQHAGDWTAGSRN
jgi:hypothetical protein